MKEPTRLYKGNEKRVRQLLYDRQSGMCGHCNIQCLPLTVTQWPNREMKHKSFVIDHVIPLALGGSNLIENLIGSCWLCNATKGARIKF